VDTYALPPGESGSKFSQLVGATSSMSIIATQVQCRHQLVQHDVAKVAAKHLSHEVHLKIVLKTGSSKNKTDHPVGCEYIHVEEYGCQLTIYGIVGDPTERHERVIAHHYGIPAFSTDAIVPTLCKMEHNDVLCPGIFADRFRDNHPPMIG